MTEIIIGILYEVINKLIEQGIKYIIKKTVDEVGNIVTQIVVPVDKDGDGVAESEEVLYSFNCSIPDLSDGYCIVNRDDEIGIGLPQFELINATDMADRLVDTVTGNNNGYLIGDDVYVPLLFDFSGDGQLDWGRVIDDDDNGIPDASDDAPFFPIGSEGYKQIVSGSGSEKSFIIVSADGTVSIYDPNGDLTEQDYNQAYSLWLKDNNALDKPFKNYSVTEALLLIVALFAGASLIGKLFKRRIY